MLLLCVLTDAHCTGGRQEPVWYLLLWGGGLIVWGVDLLVACASAAARCLFVERQVAHVWGGVVLATIGVFIVEMLLELPVLTLSPILAVIAGIIFMVKAGMLSGEFYMQAAALFLTAVPMAVYPAYGPLLFGVVLSLSFFLPGLKYHRQRFAAQKERR